jgi:GTP-binding protein EngB required for normal cell division
VTLLRGRLTGRSTARGLGIGERLGALDEVVELGRGRLDSAAVAGAERVAGKAGERLRFGEDHTVVALAGATGSGKSSLFNALAGEPVSQVGMRRPTTGVAHAAVWGPAHPAGLLDWLDVPRRHLVDPASGALDGLVLLDLPDVDSVEHSHRIEADRLVERVDLLVWVLDPQKYADAAVHDRYLAPLAGHADVMLVVLNQVDRLSPAARAGCLADLGRLLDSEGLGEVPVVAVSARTGEGLDALRSELARRVAAKRAAVHRLEADLLDVAAALDEGCGGASASGVGQVERESLVRALTDAAGADLVVGAVAANHRLRARQATGWPVTRWLSRLRLDPARRFRLRATPSELVRTSLPGPSAVQRARVDSALRELGEHASAGLPDPWPVVVRSAATRARPELPDLLDRVVAGTDLEIGRRPAWWRVVGLLQLLLALVALAGVLWLAALFGIAWLQLPEPPLPHIGSLPLPTVLLGGGLVVGLVLGVMSGAVADAGARASAQRVRRRLEERVREVADEAVVAPVERELEVHTRLCRALERVRGG